MGCNCKRITEFENRYGIPENETVLGKTMRYVMKFVLFAIALVLSVILTPLILIWAVYAIFFGNNRIVLPNFLYKYMK